VPLAEIKKDRAFADLALVRIGRTIGHAGIGGSVQTHPQKLGGAK